MTSRAFSIPVILLACFVVTAAQSSEPDWTKANADTLTHYSAIVRFDTTAKERPAAEYIKKVLDDHGIPAQIYALEPDRPNVVARLKGNGKKRPLLMMGHTDTVTIDPTKWKFGPFSAERDGGYIYGRGTIDDKDNAAAGLMTMLLLKQYNVPLDRDVIYLAESGEEGNARVGIGHMATEHFPEIDAEYCIAEGGDVIRENGVVKYAEVETTEKLPNGMQLVARGISGHGSIPLKSNAIVHLAAAVGRIGEWRPDIKLNETTATYFRKLSQIAPPEQARYYRDVLSPDPKLARAADDWLFENEPRHSSMLRTSVSPNILQGGYRSNVIPSEAKATLDVRMVPDEDKAAFLEQVKKIVNDPAVEVRYSNANTRPAPAVARLDSELFRTVEAAVTKIYNAPTLPSMSTGATDMAQMRSRGAQCVGIGSAIDVEDQIKGFGMHSDQERLLESELYRFVRFQYEIVTALARAR
jgi:acetylornithine deacetylase/succinyl-diaminopimelate desuccinylase-like protein